MCLRVVTFHTSRHSSHCCKLRFNRPWMWGDSEFTKFLDGCPRLRVVQCRRLVFCVVEPVRAWLEKIPKYTQCDGKISPPIGLVCFILKAFFGLMSFREVHQILGSTLFVVSRCFPPWSPSSYALPPSAPWTSICCQTCKIHNWTQTVNSVGFSHHKYSSSRNSQRDIHYPSTPSIHTLHFLSLWA